MTNTEVATQPSQISKTLNGALFVGLITISSLHYVIADATNVLGLVVANTILSNSYVWNLLTASFFETSIIKLVVDGAVLFYIFKMVNYPHVEHFASYLAVCILSCTVLTSTYCILIYFATADPALIVSPMYGFGGILIAILMYARQYKGQESIAGASPIHISFHTLPVVLLLIEAGVWAAGFGKYARDLPFVVISLFMSWSYLRFYVRGPVCNPYIMISSSNLSSFQCSPAMLEIFLIALPLFQCFHRHVKLYL